MQPHKTAIMRGRQTDCQSDILQQGKRTASEKFSVIIMGAFKPHNLIAGCKGRVEDIYQRDTGHNALCLIG